MLAYGSPTFGEGSRHVNLKGTSIHLKRNVLPKFQTTNGHFSWVCLGGVWGVWGDVKVTFQEGLFGWLFVFD